MAVDFATVIVVDDRTHPDAYVAHGISQYRLARTEYHPDTDVLVVTLDTDELLHALHPQFLRRCAQILEA